MIHRVILFDKETKENLTEKQFWKVPITKEELTDFFDGLYDIEESPSIDDEIPLFVGEKPHRVFHKSLANNSLLLTFWTDGKDEDRAINVQIKAASENVIKALRENGLKIVMETFRNVLGETVLTKFKISFVGSGGVGKTTLFKLLFGKQFTTGYSPSLGVTISGDTFDFGTFRIHLWDFPGQVVFQQQWEFFLKGTDAIFLVTDSSFMNVIKTKGLMKKIKSDVPAIPLFIVANKQDLMESMQAKKIQRLLGQKTISMVAAAVKDDREKQREYFLDFLLEIACTSAGIEKPDLPVKDIIMVSGEAVDSLDGEEEVTTSWTSTEETRPLQLLLLKKNDIKSVVGKILYEVDEHIEDLINLISALEQDDALTVLEHKNRLVYIESTEHFNALLVVSGKRDEEMYRSVLRRTVNVMELAKSNNEVAIVSEQYIFKCLTHIPLVVLNENHILERTNESLIEFEHPTINRFMKQIADAFVTRSRAVDVMKEIGAPKILFYGIVQLLLHTGRLIYTEI